MSRFCVQVASWFVGHDKSRIGNNGARYTDALLLTTRQLAWDVITPIVQTDQVQCSHDLLASLLGR